MTTTTTSDRAMDVILEGIDKCYDGIVSGNDFRLGFGFGKLVTAYHDMMRPTEWATVIGGPSEWMQWLREGLAALEPAYCEDCDREVPEADDMARCPACAAAHDERWSESCSIGIDCGGPSLAEQMDAARGLK